ncbi:MAG: hypothetical protein QM781_00985 [Chitinophagaceae bacterium]
MRNLHVKGRCYLLVIFLICFSSLSAQQITGAPSSLTVNPGNFTIVDPSLQVAGSGNITDFTIQIVANYYQGDELSFDGGLAGSLGISGSYTTMSGVTGILNFSGTASPASWQSLLRTVTFRNTTAECGPGNRQIQFMSGRYLYNQFNGHYYEYVSANLNWKQAKEAAGRPLLQRIAGIPGHILFAGRKQFYLETDGIRCMGWQHLRLYRIGCCRCYGLCRSGGSHRKGILGDGA